MTTIESKEIRGITLKILYLLVAFSVTATAGIMTCYFSLKDENEKLALQIEVMKNQLKDHDRRLDRIERPASAQANIFLSPFLSYTARQSI